MNVVFYYDKTRGVTLIELLVVMVILGLVMATVTTRVGGTLGPAALRQASSQWEFSDQQLRLRARRSGEAAALRLEIGTSRLECLFDGDEDSRPTVRSLGRGVRLAKFISATQEVTYGPATIRYTDRGTTETFAIELAGAHDTRRWLLVAGITGQITDLPNEAAVREVLELLLPAGVHAR
jgi:prepilin-type N-terminal cleavage/methylation domain-containing protein